MGIRTNKQAIHIDLVGLVGCLILDLHSTYLRFLQFLNNMTHLAFAMQICFAFAPLVPIQRHFALFCLNCLVNTAGQSINWLDDSQQLR